MINIRYKPILDEYVKVIFTIYFVIIIFRLFESALLFHNYGFGKDIFNSELVGLGYDFLGAGIAVFFYFIFFFLLSLASAGLVKVLNITLLLFTTLVFFVIIKYFLYQLIPLDIFLYKYTIQEILYTVKSSGTISVSTIISLILIISLITLVVFGIHKLRLSSRIIRLSYAFVVLSIPLFFLFHYSCYDRIDKFSMNKPMYFFTRTIQYYSNTSTGNQFANIDGFQRLYPDKNFICNEYLLAYEINRKNELGKYFNEFTRSPNIVILIVEGLNDDFIHEYKGALPMPFLNSLKDKSLYWDRCFSVGERSFAVVPSILGGLPYGDIGFLLQERLPRHLSIVSVLNSNDYYTSFYYGQGAWFHQKDRFFDYNDIDLIFDNSKFSEDYEKIVVGSNNFFWGYNDKDLFDQSFKVTDTLNQDKRLDIYFTGTSHSPFVISNEEYYNKKLKEYTTEQNKRFNSTYSTYLKTIFFVDDALKDFFNEYKKRKDYENTVFIITGDHPMTELPIANSLKRYHVPLLIFSEKLKTGKRFTHTVSHLDVPETLLSFLKDYISFTPSVSTSLGRDLFSTTKSKVNNIAFMNGNREVIEFLSGDYFLSNGNLYKVDSDLNMTRTENDSIQSSLSEKLNIFANTSLFITRKNTIISSNLYCKELIRDNIFEYQNSDSIKTSSEFFHFVRKVAVPTKDLTFDVSFNIAADKGYDDVSVVYQITNSNDSILLWRNFGVNENKITQAHISIDEMHLDDTEVFFDSFIWNKNKSDLIISDMDVLLHSSSSVNHDSL